MSRLVFIDDNPRVLAQYENIVRRDDSMEVAGKAVDGRQGLALIQRTQPDVVILDMIMPRMDGLTMLRELAGLKIEQKRPEVIVVSAVGQESVVEEAFTLGARYYMMKPFQAETLLARIHQVTDGNLSFVLSEAPADYRTGEENRSLEMEISNKLHELGVPAHVRGYQYLRDAIMITVESKEALGSVTKVLYPTVAAMNNTTASRVERSIRHAVELSWTRGNRTSIAKIFGYTDDNMHRKPTNSEYIALVADRIRVNHQQG